MLFRESPTSIYAFGNGHNGSLMSGRARRRERVRIQFKTDLQILLSRRRRRGSGVAIWFVALVYQQSDPNGIRTRVTAVKGRCPGPLDDRVKKPGNIGIAVVRRKVNRR